MKVPWAVGPEASQRTQVVGEEASSRRGLRSTERCANCPLLQKNSGRFSESGYKHVAGSSGSESRFVQFRGVGSPSLLQLTAFVFLVC